MTGSAALLAAVAIFAISSPAAAQLTEREEKIFQALLAKRELAKARPGVGRPAAMRSRATAAQILSGENPDTVGVPVPPKVVTPLNKNTRAVQESAGGRPGTVLLAMPNVPPEVINPCSGFKYVLRQDWSDIGLLTCPTPTDDAKGAEVSYAHDRVSNNNIWNMRGTAGVFYSSLLDAPGAYYKTFGAYVTANRVFNSSPALAKGDSDKLGFGGAAEIGIQTENAGTHYFRLRGGAVEDRLKNTSSANITAEWLPVYDRGDIHINSPFTPFNGTAPFIFEFVPSVLVQYAAVTGKNQTLDFNDQTQALRIGPQVVLRVTPLGALSRLRASLTYHWAYETYSNRGISWLDSALTYNIDDDGQFAIKASYKKGRDEDTGTQTDIYRIALSGKI